jgi:hypothetical protein
MFIFLLKEPYFVSSNKECNLVIGFHSDNDFNPIKILYRITAPYIAYIDMGNTAVINFDKEDGVSVWEFGNC